MRGYAAFLLALFWIAPLQAQGLFGPSSGTSSLTPGTTVISGGTNTRVLFDDNGVLGENAGLTFGKGTGVLTITSTQAANTSQDGLVLANTGTASSGNQQLSPREHWQGAVWNTNSVASSQVVDFKSELIPIQGGTATLLATLGFGAQINSGGYNTVMTLQYGQNLNGLYIDGGAFHVKNAADIGYSGAFLSLRSSYLMGWASTADPVAIATNFSQVSAGLVQLGTSAANASGSLNLTNLTGTGTIITGTADATTSTGGSLQVTGGASFAKRVWMPAITASAGLQTAVLCQSSGGEVIADSVACLASSERAKIIFGPSDLGLETVLALDTIDYRYKDTGNERFDNAPNHRMVRSGFRAEDAAKVDRRLVALDADGEVRTVVPDALVATLWRAVRQQQAQIEQLRKAR